jgi:hypothetical protein
VLDLLVVGGAVGGYKSEKSCYTFRREKKKRREAKRREREREREREVPGVFVVAYSAVVMDCQRWKK